MDVRLKPLEERIVFSLEDVAELLGMDRRSARVFCARRVKGGQFIRLKRNCYVLERTWSRFSREEFLRVANLLVVPSYVSLMTALSLHEVTTQIQRGYFESISLRRSITYSIQGKIFTFHKIKGEYYLGFERRGEIFVASKEKAFLDALYLWSLGRYALDLASIELESLDIPSLKEMARSFPPKTQRALKRICKI